MVKTALLVDTLECGPELNCYLVTLCEKGPCDYDIPTLSKLGSFKELVDDTYGYHLVSQYPVIVPVMRDGFMVTPSDDEKSTRERHYSRPFMDRFRYFSAQLFPRTAQLQYWEFENNKVWCETGLVNMELATMISDQRALSFIYAPDNPNLVYTVGFKTNQPRTSRRPQRQQFQRYMMVHE